MTARRRRTVYAVCLVVGTLATACSSASTREAANPTTTTVAITPSESVTDHTAPEVTEPPATGAVDLDEQLQSTMDAWEDAAPGGGVAYVRTAEGSHVVVASGIDPKTDAPLSAASRLRMGSISKPVVATMVMQLVDQGVIGLDAPVSQYLPDLALPTDPTVRQLLGHRSGIASYTDSPAFGLVTFSNFDSSFTPDDVLSYVDPEPAFSPGESFAYSNTNYIVAGLLVEEVTGMSFADALRVQITEPLGLTSMEFADGTLDDVVGGYSSFARDGWFDEPYVSVATGAWAAGALVSTVDDLAVFFDALLVGDLVSEEAREEMLADIESSWRYGLGLHPGDHFGVGHGGAIVGSMSIAQFDVDTGEAVVVVTNNDMRRPSVIAGQLVGVLRAK